MTTPRAAPLSDRRLRLAQNKRFRTLGLPYQACSGCFAVKPHREFALARRLPSGRQGRCRHCYLDRYRADPQAFKAKARAWQVENPDRVRSVASRWREENPGKVAAISARRVAQNKLKNADRVQLTTGSKLCGKCGELKSETAYSLDRSRPDGLQRQCRVCRIPKYRRVCLAAHGDGVGSVCYLCGDVMSHGDDIWVDHVKAQARGGTDDAHNLRPVHRACNIRKSDGPINLDQFFRLVPRIALYGAQR